MNQYVTPLFSCPISSPDFQAYISKPRRRRFHDREIWPARYQKYQDGKYSQRFKAYLIKQKYPFSLRSSKIAPGRI